MPKKCLDAGLWEVYPILQSRSNSRLCLYYILDPQSEGLFKYPLLICPFVGLWDFFSGTVHGNFFIFDMNLLCQLRAQNEPKLHEKLMGRIFLIFCIKLQQHKVLKFTDEIFLEKNLFWGFWVEMGQIGPIIRFFKLYEKLTYRIFLNFCIKVQ